MSLATEDDILDSANSVPRPIQLPNVVIGYIGSMISNTVGSNTDLNTKEISLEYFRLVWYRIASNIVAEYIKKYNLNKEQSFALRKMYLKPNHYYGVISEY